MKLIYERLRHTGIILVIILAMASVIMAEEPGRRYVGSQKSDKFHVPTCKWAKKVRTQNQIWFDTIAEAKAAGCRACSVCKPEGAAVGNDNAWIYWLVGILVFLPILRWLARHKPKPRRKYQKRDRENERWLKKHRVSRPNNPYQEWLQEYIESLPKDARVKLMELRHEGHIGRVYYPHNWGAISTAMRRKQTICEVCGASSEHVHHRNYRESGDYKEGDLVVLCSMCHYCVHPYSEMSQEAYINGE